MPYGWIIPQAIDLYSFTVKALKDFYRAFDYVIMPASVPALTESPAEQAIKKWIADNYGAISKVARETGVTPQTAWYVALNKRVSRDLRVERALKMLGCPLIQRIS